jgi:hypothetical protein
MVSGRVERVLSDLENDRLQLSDMRVSLTLEAMRSVQSELAPQAIAALRAQAESVTNSPPENQMSPRPAINFNQRATQTVIMPSGDDFDVWVKVSANVQLAPKAMP